MSAHWSLGVLIGLPVVVLAVAGLAALGLFFRDAAKTAEPYDGGFLRGLSWVAGVLSVILLVTALSPVGYYPYKAEYHQWQPHGGTVQSIDKRIVGSSDSLEQKFVVRFVGSGQQYGCSDTRCASVRVGDRLSLTCKRSWEWAAVDGYDCRFLSTEAR